MDQDEMIESFEESPDQYEEQPSTEEQTPASQSPVQEEPYTEEPMEEMQVPSEPIEPEEPKKKLLNIKSPIDVIMLVSYIILGVVALFVIIGLLL